MKNKDKVNELEEMANILINVAFGSNAICTLSETKPKEELLELPAVMQHSIDTLISREGRKHKNIASIISKLVKLNKDFNNLDNKEIADGYREVESIALSLSKKIYDSIGSTPAISKEGVAEIVRYHWEYIDCPGTIDMLKYFYKNTTTAQKIKIVCEKGHKVDKTVQIGLKRINIADIKYVELDLVNPCTTYNIRNNPPIIVFS